MSNNQNTIIIEHLQERLEEICAEQERLRQEREEILKELEEMEGK